MKAFDDSGQLLNAEFDLEATKESFEIVLHSNGGVSRSNPALNPDYIPALEVLLRRLAGLDLLIEDAWVDSKALSDLPLNDRRIHPRTYTYPIRLSRITDIREFRLQIRRSVSRIGRDGGLIPGTGNKRVRFAISSPPNLTRGQLEHALVMPPSRFEALKLRLLAERARKITISMTEIGELVGQLDDKVLTQEFWGAPAEETSSEQGSWLEAGYRATLSKSKKEVTFEQIARADKTKIARSWNAATATVKHRVSKYVERGQIGARVKVANGYRCQICDGLGLKWIAFIKPDGVPYVEAHHVIQVSTLAEDVLGPRNVITVCPNHHRELHFGSATAVDLGDEFEFRIPPHPPIRVPKFKA